MAFFHATVKLPITTIQVEAKDPASGASYYYNESTGKTQWERPGEASTSAQTPLLPPLEDWVESVDETTGIAHLLQTPSICYHQFILQINPKE